MLVRDVSLQLPELSHQLTTTRCISLYLLLYKSLIMSRSIYRLNTANANNLGILQSNDLLIPQGRPAWTTYPFSFLIPIWKCSCIMQSSAHQQYRIIYLLTLHEAVHLLTLRRPVHQVYYRVFAKKSRR